MALAGKMSVMTETGLPSPWAAWFAFLGGALAWTFHLLGIYLIAEFGCVSNLAANRPLGVTVPAWMLIALSSLLLLVALAATWVGYRAARAPFDQEQAPETASQYLARAGLILSLLFAIFILVQSIPIAFYLQSC